MYLCYVDESGTPEIPGVSRNYVLAGITVPVWHWKTCDAELNVVKNKFDLAGKEIHTGWIMRRYSDQERIKDFEKLDKPKRIAQVTAERTKELLRLQSLSRSQQLKNVRGTYHKTKEYIHLTHSQRVSFINEVADIISRWKFARLFAECVDKLYFTASPKKFTIDEQAFEQVVSRYEHFLGNINTSRQKAGNDKVYGLLIHDDNQTTKKKHSELMKRFQRRGTAFTGIHSIIETPLFVNSELTGLVQVADLCSYAIRRYLDHGEEVLFKKIFERADKTPSTGAVVGVRHYTENTCACLICQGHRPKKVPAAAS